MIRLPCRVRGASALGARGPGDAGPFGTWPEPDPGEGGLDGEDGQEHDDT